MKRPVALALLLAVLAPEPARAASFWDRVREPSRTKVEQALRTALRAYRPRDVPGDDLPAFEALFALKAATILQMIGGVALNDPEILFFLGNALVLSDRGREGEARSALYRALELEPDGPKAAHGWFNLGIAANRQHDFQTERDAYTQALRLEWDRDNRSRDVANRAEASMSLGDLAAAREDYLTAYETTTDSEVRALAAWGLAVAYARDDDLPDALRYAWEASSIRFVDAQGNAITALDLPSVFFTPPHEVFYYRALAAMAASEHTDELARQKMELEWAISQWHRYLHAAREQGDRWIPNVNFQLKWCERKLEVLVANQRPRARK